ncbi:MAG: thiol-disulfide oxidoreductase DCC family protein [Methylophilaceae bacterium]
MNIQYPLTIYYDASCPMCKTEMETLKETDKDNQLILVDCASPNIDLPASCPVTREALMERIHAMDSNGKWINSTDVFAAAYSASGFKKLGKIWGNKTLNPFFSHAYPWVADNRHWLSKTPLPYLLNKFLRFSAKL